MKKTLLVLVSIAAIIRPAMAQYSYSATPGPTLPYTPGATLPGSPPDTSRHGYDWREQRGSQDWRNNTWREQRFDQDWRNNDWRQNRANEDWQQREENAKERTPNNAVDRGYGSGKQITKKNNKEEDEGCGTGTVGAARPCPGTSSNGGAPAADAYGR